MENGPAENIDNQQNLNQETVISQLKAEHASLEAQLAEFDSKVYLTPFEQLERKKIQKLKLAKKDRILLLTKQ